MGKLQHGYGFLIPGYPCSAVCELATCEETIRGRSPVLLVSSVQPKPDLTAGYSQSNSEFV